MRIITSLVVIFLLKSSSVTSLGNPPYVIPDNLRRPFINVASSSQGASCTETSADPSHKCTNAIDDDVNTEYRVNSNDNSVNSSISITFSNGYLINAVKITQRQDASYQIQEVKISFDDGKGVHEYFNLTKNTASQSKADTFIFGERLTKTIIITISTLYNGTTGHGYKSIEVTNTFASSDKLCEYLTIDSSSTSPTVGVYSDTSVLSIIATELHMILATTTSASSPRYVLKFGAQSNSKLILDRFGPPGSDSTGVAEGLGALSSSNWKLFGVDFSAIWIAVNVGNVSIFQYNDANPIQVNYVSFHNPGSTKATVLYCNRKVKCYKNATHFWSLDKPTLSDVFSRRAAITDITNVKAGPGAALVTTTAISLKNNQINLGDFSNECVSNPNLCSKGMTVALWLNIDLAASGAQTILSSDTNSPGIRIYYDSSDLYGVVHDGSVKHTAKLPASKGVWHHVAITWSSLLGLRMMIDFNSKTQGSSAVNLILTDSNTLLTLGAKNDMSGSADAIVSSLAIWYEALELYHLQKIGIAAGITPGVLLSSNTDIHLNLPIDQITTNNDKQDTAELSQLNYNDGNPNSAGWQPFTATGREYLQLDFVLGRSITRLLTQGGGTTWVTVFTLSHSLDGIQWEKYQINGSVYNFRGNSDSSSIVSHRFSPLIEARVIRIFPVSWHISIAMRVGVFFAIDPFLSKGCYTSTSLNLRQPSNNINPSAMHPGMCVTPCGIGSYKYAGLTVESRCYCINTLPSTGKVSKYKCNEPCRGNPAFMCGSQSHVSIYDVREPLNNKLSITIPSTAMAMEKFKVTSDSHHFFISNFWDGIFLTTNNSELEYFVLTADSRRVLSSTWIGRYGVPRQIKTTKKLDVGWSVMGTNITYNKIVESNLSYLVNATIIEGKDVVMTLTKRNASEGTSEYYPPNSNLYRTSRAKVRQRITTSGPTAVDRVYLLVDNQFKTGVLKAFSAEVASKGYVKLQIYRPVCRRRKEKQYCYISGHCSSSIPKCTGSSSDKQTSCSAPKFFSLTTSRCTISSLVFVKNTVGQVGGPLTANFELVFEQLVYLTAGVHLFLAQNVTPGSGFKVRDKDIIGVTLPPVTGAELNMARSHKRIPYKTGVNVTVGGFYVTANYNSTALDFSPLVRATYVVSAEFSLSLNCSVGHYFDTFNFSTGHNYETQSAEYVCIERIRNVKWGLLPYVEVGMPLNITVYKHYGYNVTHILEFDNNAINNTIEPPTNFTHTYERVDRNITFQHTFDSVSNYTITMAAYNILGSFSRLCTVAVLNAVQAVIIDSVTPTAVNTIMNISWTVYNGTETHCNVSYGDGHATRVETGTINVSKSYWVAKTYQTFGEYWVNISCGNPVSEVVNITMVVVEVPVKSPVVCKVKSFDNNPWIEVNETVEFQSYLTNKPTNVVTRLEYGDGNFNETREYTTLVYSGVQPYYRYSKVLKSYSYWTVFNTNITVYNNVSSENCSMDVTVHKPVYPIIITSLTARDANLSTPTAFMMNISSGNDFNCTWNFGNSYIRYNGSSFSTLGSYVYYEYSIVKCYTVIVFCANRLYTATNSTIACVYLPIENLTLTAPSHQDINIGCPISFRAGQGTSIHFRMTWNNVTTLQTKNITITSISSTSTITTGSTTIKSSYFPQIGTYKVKLFAENKVTSTVVRSEIVKVHSPISKFAVQSSHEYIEVNHVVNLKATVDSGSNVTVYWDFQDGMNQSHFFNGDTLRLGGDIVNYSFQDSGLFKVSTNFSNPLESFVSLTNIYVQYPVKKLELKTNSPQIIPTGTTTFTLKVPQNIRAPTDAFIDVTYGSIGVDSDKPFGTEKVKNFSKSIVKPGLYQVNINISNKISWQQINTTIDVQREIKGLELFAVNTGAGDTAFGTPGLGKDKNAFPREIPVRFNVRTTDGSNMTFFFNYGDNSSYHTQDTYSTHLFEKRGNYNITVIANNSVSEMQASIEIVLMDSNIGLFFDNDGPTSFPLKTTFTLKLSQIGNEACCLVDLTNKTYFIYKDNEATTCRDDWKKLSKVQNVVKDKLDVSLSFSFKFWQKKYYYVKAACHNTVSYVEKQHVAIILPLPCAFPVIDLRNVGKTYEKRKLFFRSSNIKIHSKVDVYCYASRRTDFLWTVYSVNDTGHSQTPYKINSEGSTTNRSVLELPPRTLPLGKYKFQLNVSIVALDLVYRTAACYVEIVPSPLQCFVYGGSGWLQSVYRDMQLAGHLSYDPDENEDNNTNWIEHYFYCRKNGANYTFPKMPLLDTIEQAKGGGGCLRNEAGFISKGMSIKTYLNGTFKVNDSLEFRLYCMKGSRLGFFDVFLKMADIDPPRCQLSIDSLTFNRQVISSSKVTIRANCNVWEGTEADIVLKWDLFKKVNISDLEIKDLKDFLHIQGDRNFLVLRKDSLDDCSSYMAKLVARFGDGPPGFTYIDITTHCSPKGGRCAALPQEGFSTTPFKFKCEGWNSSGGDLHFYFYYKTRPYDLPWLFVHTEQLATDNITLPEGDEAFDYNVDVIVQVVDSVEAITEQTFKVKVKPKQTPPDESLYATLRKDILDKNGRLVDLDMNDNSQALNQWCHHKAKILNNVSKGQINDMKNLTRLLQELETFLDELPTKDPPGTDHKKTAEVPVLKAQIEDLTNQSKKYCEIRERIALSVFNVQLESITTIQMTSVTISELAGSPEDHCIPMLVHLTGALKKISDFFIVKMPSLNFDDVRSGMSSFSQASAAVLRGFSDIWEKSIQGDTQEKRQNVQLAANYSDLLIDLIQDTISALKDCCIVLNEFPTKVFSPELNSTFAKNTLDVLYNLSLHTGSGMVNLKGVLDEVFGDINDTSLTVTTEARVFKDNPFTGDNSSRHVHSMVCDFQLSNKTGPIKLQNLTTPLEIWIRKKGPLSNCFRGKISYHDTEYHIFEVTRNESSVNVDVREVVDNSQQAEFSVSLRKGRRPNENEDDYYDLPTIDEDNQTVHTKFFASNKTNNTMAGVYYVAVKYNRTLNGKEISQENMNKVVNYSMCVYTSECIFWDEKEKRWVGFGCQAGRRSNLTHTQCLCNHATGFGSDFVVPPNRIDWDKITLEELFNNFLVAGVLLGTIGLYLLLLIPARRQDIKDLTKLGVIPIPSNDPRDSYGYEICLYTGFQRGSGTTAQVSIILSGSKNNTQPRVLQDIDKKSRLFQRGCVDSFLLTTPFDLGQVESVKLWHNFGGENPSWYLSRMYVRDLQTDTKTWYICNRWFAVEEDDGKIERVLHPACNSDLTSFNLLFQSETRKNFSDSHLWFSVYYRPPQSTFTRVQRLTCCLCILLSTMLANAMFYQTGEDTRNAEVVIGPFRLSTQQISIAITSSLVVLPINMIIINIFRKARLKDPPNNENTKQFLDKNRRNSGTQSTHEEDEETEHVYEEISLENKSDVDEEGENNDENTKKVKKETPKEPKKPFTLPHWSVYIAYVLAFLTCATSSVITVFYSLTFGKPKAEGWLSAMMISFWQDVLISQPIKVLAIAVLVALIIKDPKKMEEGTKRSAELGHDEEWVHRKPDTNEKVQFLVPKPPTEDVLYERKQILLKQKEMKAIIKEIVVYFLYLMVLCVVAYGGVDPQSFQISQATKAVFAESSYAGADPFDSVVEPVKFWKWLHSTMIPALKPNYWYGPYKDNQEEVLWSAERIKHKARRGWRFKVHKRVTGTSDSNTIESVENATLHKFPQNVIADRGTAYIIGSARLRQLRVRRGECDILPTLKRYFHSCTSPYTWENEDDTSYLPGWKSVNKSTQEILAKDDKSAWVWRSAWDLQGTPFWGIFATYWGGGYVANLELSRLQTIDEMQNLELETWIDRHTRVVFTEFALYNAYNNFFCVITMLSEIIPTGGYHHYVQFRPIRLYRYTGPETYTLMAFELVYIIFLFVFTYSEFKELFRRKGKYFQDPWNFVEILIIVLSFVTIGLFFARLAFGKYAVSRMRKNPGGFVSFTYVLLLDEYQIATLGFVVFFNILKSFRLLRFNRRMSLLTRTVKECAAPLMSFSVLFLIVLLAYVQFAFLVFGPTEEDYSSFSTCLSTIMTMTLGGFDFETLANVNRILGPIFFFSFMLFVFMILVNVFLSIINDTLANVSSDVALQSNDYEIMDFVVHQIKLAAGAHVGPAVKPVYKKIKTQLQRDIDAIESLSENIEYALTNTIVEEQRQTNWLKPENMTRKKLIVLQEVLRRQEGDQDEDDLANLIPMMEQFLIKNGNRDAVRKAHNHETDVVSLEDVDFDMKKSSRSSSFDSNNQHLYESLSNNATNITAETLPHLEDSLICSQGNKEELVDDIYESPTADVSDDDWFVDSVTSSGKLVETVKTENLESAQQNILKNGRPSKDEATDDKKSDNKEYENPTYQNESLLSPKGPGESTDSPMSTLSGPAHSTVTRPSFCDSLYNYEENSTL